MERDLNRTPTSEGMTAGPLAVDSKGVAAALSICDRTARQLIADGDLPSFRIGRRRLVPAAALEAFIDHRLAEAS